MVPSYFKHLFSSQTQYISIYLSQTYKHKNTKWQIEQTVHWADVSLDVVKIKVGALSDTVYRVGTILY